jgi:flagellar biosynthesis protein FlhA
VRDLVRILETLTERACISKDLEGLTEAARAALGPAISSAHASNGRLPVITIEPWASPPGWTCPTSFSGPMPPSTG